MLVILASSSLQRKASGFNRVASHRSERQAPWSLRSLYKAVSLSGLVETRDAVGLGRVYKGLKAKCADVNSRFPSCAVSNQTCSTAIKAHIKCTLKPPLVPGMGERLLEAEPPLQARSTCQMPPVIYSEASDILPSLISFCPFKSTTVIFTLKDCIHASSSRREWKKR